VRRWGTFRSALAASERSIAGTNAGKILSGVRDQDFYLKHAHPVNHRNELVGFVFPWGLGDFFLVSMGIGL
jgi:hypothetical protein